MSDKPEKIWLIQMDDYNLVWSDCPDPTNGDTIPDEDRTEYVRADLAKPSERIERKARAFDWFVAEMMDEELKILMEKGGYKTPLEAIEKAMISPTRETP